MNNRVLLTAFLVSSLVLDASGGRKQRDVRQVKQDNSFNSHKYHNKMNQISSRKQSSQNQVPKNSVIQLLLANTSADDSNQSGNQKRDNRGFKKNEKIKTDQKNKESNVRLSSGENSENGKNQPGNNTDISSDNRDRRDNTGARQQKSNVPVVNNNAPASPQAKVESPNPNIPGPSDTQSTQAYEPLIKKQKALLDKAADLLVFFGNGREKDRLNFNAMSIDQQNTVLDKAINLVGEIHTNNEVLKKASDAKVKASYDDLVFRQGRIISTFTDSIQELANAGKTFYDMYWAGWGEHTDGTKTSKGPIFTTADGITLPKNLLTILKDVRESPRAVSALLGFYKEYYGADGNQITGGFFMTYNEALKHLTPLFNKSGVSEYELAEFAALFGAKQSFFAIVEKLQLKGFSIEKNKSLLSYYEKHMLGLEKLKSIKTIAEIKGVTSAHALLALLKSLKNSAEQSFKSSILTKLSGKEETVVSGTETITLIESLLADAYAGNSITLEKLLEKVIQEVKDEMVTYYKDKDFGSVFDSENLEKNIVDESDVIKEVVEHVKVDDSVKSHGKFFETNEKVLKLIAAKGDDSKEYSKCLIDEVLKHGDDASILHVLALLDPENHAEIFNAFENKKVVVNGELEENNLRLFIGYVKQNQDKLFKNGVTFKDEIDVGKEIEHALQDYSGHESLKESCILLEAVRNNARKATPGTTTSTDRKE